VTGDELTRKETHQALEVLYDNVALADCALARYFPDIEAIADPSERALRLRAIVLEAIEMLRPARRAPFGSREMRACDVLTLRYVERLSVAEMMEELALGRRQVFRDLRQAEEKLTQLLAAYAAKAQQEQMLPSEGTDTLSSELAVLKSEPSRVALSEVIRAALGLVEPLAREFNVDIQSNCSEHEELVLADQAILKQVLVQLLSAAIQTAPDRPIKISTRFVDAWALISVLFWPTSDVVTSGKLLEIQRIVNSTGMEMRISEGGSACHIELALKRTRPLSILVVEDNPGAVELYERYLSGNAWQVSHVSEPRLALDMARKVRPDVIVLDIMMPHMDGWTILQMLRQNAETSHIPVMVCSVVEDEELSRVLGAAVSLKKPVSHGDFMAAIQRCLRLADRRYLHRQEWPLRGPAPSAGSGRPDGPPRS